MQTVHSHKTNSYTFILSEDEWYSATEQQREAWRNQIEREGKEVKCGNLNILVKPDGIMSISPVAHTHSVYCRVVRKSVTFSQAVRYMMDQCDKHGLHHEVLSEFMDEYQTIFNKNEELCRAGKPQVAPDFGAMANAALMEWDI